MTDVILICEIDGGAMVLDSVTDEGAHRDAVERHTRMCGLSHAPFCRAWVPKIEGWAGVTAKQAKDLWRYAKRRPSRVPAIVALGSPVPPFRPTVLSIDCILANLDAYDDNVLFNLPPPFPNAVRLRLGMELEPA